MGRLKSNSFLKAFPVFLMNAGRVVCILSLQELPPSLHSKFLCQTLSALLYWTFPSLVMVKEKVRH